MGKGFVGCVRNCFGLLPGKKISDLAAEIKQLTPQDRWDLASGFYSGHMSEKLSEDALIKERAKAAEAGIVAAAAGYGGLTV